MKVLITGAGGFLGRRVVAAVHAAKHQVRAMVRPSADVEKLGWDEEIDVFRADLRANGDLLEAMKDVDAVAHLATAMVGDDFSRFSDSVVGTERLFEAMTRSTVKRLLLCSSFAVYDLNGVFGTLDEEVKLFADIYQAGAYSMAKFWQERMARRLADEHNWDLTVLRPGFIWGDANQDLACLGQRLGKNYFVFGGARRLALTHVDNCADCFRVALENSKSIGETFNVVDGDDVRAWRYVGEYLLRSGNPGRRVYLPQWLPWLAVQAVNLGSRFLFKGQGKLPSMFVPCRYALRYKPLRFSNRKLRRLLNWTPPLRFEQCLERTYGAL